MDCLLRRFFHIRLIDDTGFSNWIIFFGKHERNGGILRWDSAMGFKQAIDSFVFQDNRSIEHLHPQNPEAESESWRSLSDKEIKLLRDCFGNLALITPRSNTSISNLPVNEKFARIKGRLGRGFGLESLKLLRMGLIADFDESGWTPKKVNEHKTEMFRVLGYSISSNQPSDGNADMGG